jgi:hypothetical protein
MPITVGMVDILGKLNGTLIPDTPNSFLTKTKQLPLGDPEYPYLGAIELYGDTTFGPSQIKRLLEEWKRWSVRAQTAAEKELVRRVQRLAEECVDRTMYLKFYGD